VPLQCMSPANPCGAEFQFAGPSSVTWVLCPPQLGVILYPEKRPRIVLQYVQSFCSSHHQEMNPRSIRMYLSTKYISSTPKVHENRFMGRKREMNKCTQVFFVNLDASTSKVFEAVGCATDLQSSIQFKSEKQVPVVGTNLASIFFSQVCTPLRRHNTGSFARTPASLSTGPEPMMMVCVCGFVCFSKNQIWEWWGHSNFSRIRRDNSSCLGNKHNSIQSRQFIVFTTVGLASSFCVFIYCAGFHKTHNQSSTKAPASPSVTSLTLRTVSDDHTKAQWPHTFEFLYTVELSPDPSVVQTRRFEQACGRAFPPVLDSLIKQS